MKREQKKQRYLDQLRRKLDEHGFPAEDEAARLPHQEEERQSLVERRIQEAIANGVFDNLPGRGKPLDLLTNPYLEPGQELAFNLLKHNGFAPEWIERDLAIRRDLAAARSRLRLVWQHYRAQPAGRAAAWEAAVTRFGRELEKLNRRIDDFNLVVPVITCQRFRLRLADEVQRVQQGG